MASIGLSRPHLSRPRRIVRGRTIGCGQEASGGAICTVDPVADGNDLLLLPVQAANAVAEVRSLF